MTKEIFHQLMEKWNAELVESSKKILLLVDNFSGHKIDSLSNIRIEFLPPNITSKVQPLDLGIIANFNHYFKQIREGDEVYSSRDNLDMNSVFEIAARAVDMIRPETFNRCFESSTIYTSVDEDDESEDDMVLENENSDSLEDSDGSSEDESDE